MEPEVLPGSPLLIPVDEQLQRHSTSSTSSALKLYFETKDWKIEV